MKLNYDKLLSNCAFNLKLRRYSAVRKFHEQCDNRGPTVTIMRLANSMVGWCKLNPG